MKKMVKKLAVLLAAVMMIGMFAGCGTSTADYSSTVVATYGDENIYMDEANFFLRYQQWYQEGSYWDMYTMYFGYANMWEAESGNGTQTMGQYLKEEVMAQILQTRILMDHAAELGVSLTEEDKAKVAEAAESFKTNIHADFQKYAPYTDADLIEWLEKNALAIKVWDTVKKSKEVEVSDEECAMFTVEYAYIAAPVEGETVEEGALTNEERANEALSRLMAGEAFVDFEEELDLTSYTNSYLKKDDSMTIDLYTAGVTMKTGDVTMVGDAESGWYVIKCLNDSDEEASEQKRAEVADSKQEEYFNEVYAGWAASAKAFDVKKSWNDVKFSGEKIYVAAETTAAE